MPSVSERSSSVHSAPSPGRRILSKLTSPFGSKARNIVDFSIEPDDPHKQYSPGDIVSGHVNLRVGRPIRVTHITICLHGYVQVHKNPGQPAEDFRANPGYLGSGPGRKYGEYYGNGFASLFEDEIVLCGDGRLAEGAYQFNFELEFPDRDLPSSIDFERGTITYMLSTTITRPNTISPTITCDRKVYFVERIDISPLYPPKSRTITLEPLSKRSRAKSQAQKLVTASEKRSRKTDSAQQGSDPLRDSGTSSAPSTHADAESTISPEPSETSYDNNGEGPDSQNGSQIYGSQSGSEATGTQDSSSGVSLANKVITATVESQAGGCLRGDGIPIKINVCHTKQVRSMYGVIVTLYRQARVDMRPSIPLGPREKGKAVKYEDYYPKSRTGLGGLSLSGAGSSHVFRKDLSQVMAPLVINPDTLTADINARVRVPEEAFPTISTVPGAMISFKYYVEVVLDIQGRLAGQDRNIGPAAGHAGLPNLHVNIDSSDLERSAFTPFGSTIIETAPIRRDKSVVTCTFEVIIGTRDSERKRGKRKMMEAIEESEPNPETVQRNTQQEEPVQTPGAHAGVDWYQAGTGYDHYWDDRQYGYYHQHDADQAYEGDQAEAYDQPPPHVPLPQMPDEATMTEKERIQQAEARLLPSQPPELGSEQAGEGASAPTAPYIPEETEVPGTWPAAPSYSGPASNSAVLGTNSTSAEHESFQRELPVPEYHPPAAGSSVAHTSGDDKQEIQRQELQAQASAPPATDPADVEDDDDDGTTEAAPHAPSAPTLAETDAAENDLHDSHLDAPGSSDLPRYER